MVIGGGALGWGGGVYDKVIGVKGWGWGGLQSRHSMVEPTQTKTPTGEESPPIIYKTDGGQAFTLLSNVKNIPRSIEGHTATPYPEK